MGKEKEKVEIRGKKEAVQITQFMRLSIEEA
jgi:hypothetical protein